MRFHVSRVVFFVAKNMDLALHRPYDDTTRFFFLLFFILSLFSVVLMFLETRRPIILGGGVSGRNFGEEVESLLEFWPPLTLLASPL